METIYILPHVVSEPGSGSETIPHATTYYLASSPGPSLPGRMARRGRAWGRGYIQPCISETETILTCIRTWEWDDDSLGMSLWRMNLANLFKSHFSPWDSGFRLTKDKQKTKTIHAFSFRNSRGWSLTWAGKRWKHYCTSNALSCSSFSSLLPPPSSLLPPLSSFLPSPSPPFLPSLHRWNLPFVCNSTT